MRQYAIIVWMCLFVLEGCSVQSFLSRNDSEESSLESYQDQAIQSDALEEDCFSDEMETENLLVDQETFRIISSIEEMISEASNLCDSLEFTEAAKLLEEAQKLSIEVEINTEDDPALVMKVVQLQESFINVYRKILSSAGYLPGESPLTILLRMSSEERGEAAHWSDEKLKEVFLEIGRQCDIKPVYNHRVRKAIETILGPSREHFELWLKRSGRYLPMIREIFRDKGIPEDIAYLAMIESGFNPRAWSRAHAAGLWQFIQSTGKIYNLNRDWWIDERYDPEKSTRAAAQHLLDLYREFNSWDLAMAAYNNGQRRIKNALERQDVDNYWGLDLVWETYNYVPLFYAAMVISKAPEVFGFGSIVVDEMVPYDVVELTEGTDLKVAALCAGMTYEEIRSLNPELRRSSTPPVESGSQNKRFCIRIAKGSRDAFIANLKKVPPEKKLVKRHHRVRKGETLQRIARKYGISIRAIAQLNGIRNIHRIHPGRLLKIPGHYASTNTVTNVSEDRNRSSGMVTSVTGSDEFHVVRRGENLWLIARKYGTTIENLKRLNQLNGTGTIYPGSKLRLRPEKEGPTVAMNSPAEEIEPSITSGETYKVTVRDTILYTVKPGDTLSDIAVHFKVGVNDLVIENNINNVYRLQKGTVLRIIRHMAPEESMGTVKRHVVERGETLWEIANRYEVPLDTITRKNKLTNSRRINVGQILLIPISSSISNKSVASILEGQIQHQVKKGENLFLIARRYGTSVEDIKSMNNIKNEKRIYPGQKLIIPLSEE